MARLPKNDKVVDIGTIAAALGVSKTTVSRAISGNGRVGAATRQRVQDYVKEHNYTPSVMARGLAMRCSYNISLVISKQFSDFEMPFLRKTMRSVYQAAEDCDYDVLLTLVGENETRPVERLLDNRKIDGLILTRTLERDPLIPLLKSRKLPFVAIGRPEDPTVMSVDHDQVGGCRELTSLLLMKGMKRIALLGGTWQNGMKIPPSFCNLHVIPKPRRMQWHLILQTNLKTAAVFQWSTAAVFGMV